MIAGPAGVYSIHVYHVPAITATAPSTCKTDVCGYESKATNATNAFAPFVEAKAMVECGEEQA